MLTLTYGAVALAALPRASLEAGLRQHPFAELRHQPRVLGQRHEAQRQDRAADGMVPAHERLEPQRLASRHVDDRLVVQDHLLACQRGAKIE